MHRFKDLVVWQKARVFVKNIYETTANFPKEEKYGITSQLQRASFSITNNIAEGSGRQTEKQFAQFLEVAYSSCIEVENILILCFDLALIKEEDYKKLNNEIINLQKMIFSLRKKIIANV